MQTRHLPTRPGVYLLRCTHNGLTYVGSSLDVRHRVQNHMKRLEHQTHGCQMLLSAYLAAGPKRFEAVLLRECAPDELNSLEEAEWNRLKQAGLLLAGSEHFITQVDREKNQARSAAMQARWADPEKRAALVGKINAVRATQAFRDECRGRNKAAVAARWAAATPGKGAYFRPKEGIWVAQIRVGAKRKYLGRFVTQEEAHAAYLAAWEKRKR
jgi:group I intron endonuclease